MPKKIVFVTGGMTLKNTLTKQILKQVQSAFSPGVMYSTTGWRYRRRSDTLYVSLLPSVPADVLLGYDLADRRHYFQTNANGQPELAAFDHILVPGSWTQRQILNRNTIDLKPEQVLVTGSPRIDYLRTIQPQFSRQAGRPKILIAPIHPNWKDKFGDSLSIAEDVMDWHNTLGDLCDVTYQMDPQNTYKKVPITDALLHSDIVITDYTSLIYEAWALGKPVVFPRWLTGSRILQKSDWIAEAEIYRERIGHHPMSIGALRDLVRQGQNLALGDGVDAFMRDYLLNYEIEGQAGRRIATALEYLSDTSRMMQEATLLDQGKAALNSGDVMQAEEHFSLARKLNGGNIHTAIELANIYHLKNDYLGEVKMLEAALQHGRTGDALNQQLAGAYHALGQHDLAYKHYEHAVLNKSKSVWKQYYEVGCLSGHYGASGNATKAFEKALALFKTTDAKIFGVGILHMQANLWAEGLAALLRISSADLPNRQTVARLHYLIGYCYDRCYDWKHAEISYRSAISGDPTQWSWHARLGFVLERQRQWDGAATSYLYAAANDADNRTEYLYRAGYIFEEAGETQAALDAYAGMYNDSTVNISERAEKLAHYKSSFAHSPNDTDVLDQQHVKFLTDLLAKDCTDPSRWQALSALYERCGETTQAAYAMEQAIWRAENHNAKSYYTLGRLLAQQGKRVEACAAYRQSRIFQRNHGTDQEDAICKDKALYAATVYREFHDTLDIVPKTILYESFGGEGISDNPLAIYNQVRTDKRFDGWRHIWVIDDTAKIPENLRGDPDVFFVTKNSERYQWFLCCAAYLINNATFPFYFVRKNGQEYLNTWHGTPLKTLGYDITTTPLQRANTARNLIQSSLFIAPNQHTENVMLDRYGVRQLFNGRNLLTGYPRIDATLNATDDDRQVLYRHLGLDPAKPVVLFAPTYRGHWATPELEAEEMAGALQRMKSDDYNLVFRGHYFAEKTILDMDLPVTVAPHAIDTCQLLAIVDVLVTDYSSIFYDFLVTGRPVIHYIYDWDRYVETRGVYFGKNDLPGIVCEDETSLIEAVHAAIDRPGDQISATYKSAHENYCAFEDGQASARVVEALFFHEKSDQDTQTEQGGKRLFVHCGDLSNDVHSDKLKKLLKETQAKGWQNIVIVDRRAILDKDERIQTAQGLLEFSDVLIRFGRSCYSVEEIWLEAVYRQAGTFPSLEAESIFRVGMKHETRRLVGSSSFDFVLDFDASRPFWLQLMSAFESESHAACPGYIVDMTFAQKKVTACNIAAFAHYDTIFALSSQQLVVNRTHLELSTDTVFSVLDDKWLENITDKN